MTHAFFTDLPASRFPIVLEICDVATGELRWTETVTGPAVVHIPGKGETNKGQPVFVRVGYGDGVTTELHPHKGWETI